MLIELVLLYLLLPYILLSALKIFYRELTEQAMFECMLVREQLEKEQIAGKRKVSLDELPRVLGKVLRQQLYKKVIEDYEAHRQQGTHSPRNPFEHLYLVEALTSQLTKERHLNAEKSRQLVQALVDVAGEKEKGTLFKTNWQYRTLRVV